MQQDAILDYGQSVKQDAISDSKTFHDFKISAPPVMRDKKGVWHVRGYAAARTILLADTTQAGFNAELVAQAPFRTEPPVLFQDGAEHREQRAQIAKFFTPAYTEQQHLGLMEKYADEIVGEFEAVGAGDLNKMTARMAMAVVADVVGLTNSDLSQMARRLDAILRSDPSSGEKGARGLLSSLRVQWNIFRFYVFDVRPAIRARTGKAEGTKQDVIAHLVSKGRKGQEILIECITYGVAGMVTTQEFISLAAWQMLQHESLRQEFLQGDRETRYRVLHELLRLDPVIAGLARRAASDLTLAVDGGTVTIPRGALIELHLNEINTDARTAGAEPLVLNAERELEKSVSRSLMGFGSGPHRCVGEFIALAEVDVFLQRLMRVEGLQIVQEPTILRNENIKGYELRNFMLRLIPKDGIRHAEPGDAHALNAVKAYAAAE